MYFDGNSFNKRRILAALKEAGDTNAESVELTFNVFSLIIRATKNEVELLNDVDESDPGLTMPMDQFQIMISQSTTPAGIEDRIKEAYRTKELICVCVHKIVWDRRIIGFVRKIYASGKFDLDVIDEWGQRKGVKRISFASVKSLEVGGTYNDNLKLLYMYGFVRNQSRPRYFSAGKHDLSAKLRELKETATVCTFFFGTEYSHGRVANVHEDEFVINNIGYDGSPDGTSVYTLAGLTKIRCHSNHENRIDFLHEHSPITITTGVTIVGKKRD